MKLLQKSFAIRALVPVLVTSVTVYAFVNSQRATDWAGLSTAGPLPISLEQAPGLFQQCSWHAPIPEGAVWIPQDSEIRDLEQRLGYFFSQNTHLHERMMEPQLLATSSGRDPDLAKYKGQFVGFERAGKKYILASYLAHSVARSGQKDHNAIIFCNDGSHIAAWGIVYDLQRGELVEFSGSGGW